MSNSPSDQIHRPRVGVPWRTAGEEIVRKRDRYDSYLNAIREAGGAPVEVSLYLPDSLLREVAESLDAVLLPGSPADVDPRGYGAARHTLTADADERREHTDSMLLDHAFASGKPVLAICYGTQLLNVYLGGSLVQDIPSEVLTDIDHDHEEHEPDAVHSVRIDASGSGKNAGGDRLAEIASLIQGHDSRHAGEGTERQIEVRVNSSHHQSILDPARGLQITARAPDSVIEAVEWRESSPWIVGVQWHPERMPDDALSKSLFRALVSQALVVRGQSGGNRQ